MCVCVYERERERACLDLGFSCSVRGKEEEREELNSEYGGFGESER